MQRKKDISTNPKPRKTWRRRIWAVLPTLFLLGLAAIVVMLFFRIKSEKEILAAEKEASMQQQRPDVNVVALELRPTRMRDRINLPGTIAPWLKLDIVAEIDAKIIKKRVEEGDAVKKGQIIAQLDTRDYLNAYNSAKASYDTSLAALNRYKKLHSKKITPQSQLDNAVAEVANHKAAMQHAALDLERCKIKAPLDGVVNRLYIENGQYLRVADKVAEILQIDRLKVKVGIPESDVDAVRKLTDFDVRIDALKAKIFKAQMHYLSKTTNNLAHLYDLTLKLDNPTGEILPDMFARVEIVKKEIPDAICVPLYSVVNRNNEQIVYTVNDNRAQMRKVELGLLEGWRCEIKKGLAAGEAVIVVGQRNVTEGQKVNVVRRVKTAEEILQ